MRVLKIVLVVEAVILLLVGLFWMAGKGNAARVDGYNFEKDTRGWVVIDKSVAGISHDKADAGEGQGSLRFDYHYEEGKLPVCGTHQINLEGKKALRFWVKAATPTVMAVVIHEKDDSNYFYPVGIGQAHTWQEVVFNLDQMNLGEDSSDENDVIDTCNVSIGFVDFLTILTRTEDERTLWIDSVSFEDEAVLTSGSGDEYYEKFEAGTGHWIAISPQHSSIKVTDEASQAKEGEGALEFSYTISPENIIALACFGITFLDDSEVSVWNIRNSISRNTRTWRNLSPLPHLPWCR